MKALIFRNVRQLSLSEVEARKHVSINNEIPACVRAAVKEKEIVAFLSRTDIQEGKPHIKIKHLGTLAYIDYVEK
jgi:hypothetical protein